MAKDKKKETKKAEEISEQETEQTAVAEKEKEPEQELLQELDKKQQELEKKQQELEETIHLLQRNQADFENFRRRNNSVRAESYESGKRDAVAEILPALDDFERIMANADKADEAWVEGVKLVYRKLTDSVKKLGLTEIETEGKFDPNLHNAVLSEAAEGVESETILAVLQKGYKMGDKIIRHSMVKVSE